MFNPAEEMSSLAFDKILGGALTAVVSAQNNSSMTTVNFIKSVGFQNDIHGNTVKPVYVDFKYPKEIAAYVPGRDEYFSATVISSNAGLDEDRLNSNGYEISDNKSASFKFVVDTQGKITVVDIVTAGNLSGDEEIKVSEGENVVARFKIVKHEKVESKPAVYQDMTLQVPLLTIVPIPFIRVASTDIELNVKINSISNTSESSETSVDSKINASASAKILFFKGNININASVSHQKKKSSTEEIKKEYSLNIKIHAVQDDLPVGMSRILDVLEESIVPKLANPTT